jgi:excisionase family DNA binding protein
MAQNRMLSPLTVAEAAAGLHVSPRTVRRLLQAGRLGGRKLGREWVVWWPKNTNDKPVTTFPQPAGGHAASPAALRERLRQVGDTLITVGNQVAGTTMQRGAVFLAWRRPGSLQVTLAIGRAHPTRGWAPHVLGTALPFWLTERQQWQPILPLLRRYEQLRLWCAPRLLRIPGVADVIQTELTRLATAVETLAPAQTGTPHTAETGARY